MNYLIVEEATQTIFNVTTLDDAAGFDPGEGLFLVEAPPGVWIGHRLVEGEWIAPEQPEQPSEPSVEQALDVLADYRWHRTQTMPLYDGSTDVPADTARSVITSKVLAAQFLTDEQRLERQAFKLKPGEWRDWNIPDLVAYGVAIGVHMQTCFDRERALKGEIIVAYPEVVDITTGWPA